jgi:hypothetical protein
MVFFYDTADLTPDEEQVIEDYLYRTAYHFKSKAFRIVASDSLTLKALDARKANNRTVAFASAEPMEKLIIYNGSPRRSGSNSAMVLNMAAENIGSHLEIRDLKEEHQWDAWAESFTSEKHVMFFMPLYVHAMPSHVMGFIEKLQASDGSISFFVQSGFPESSQSHYLEAYFERLANRLGRAYIGTAIKGGLEGLQLKPAKQQNQAMEPMIEAIMSLVDKGKYEQKNIYRLASPISLGPVMQLLIKILRCFGLINFIWDRRLKENHAFEKRFDHPYVS